MGSHTYIQYAHCNTLFQNMHINNTQFGILVSSVTLVNTILPLLAGVFIDDLSSLGSIRGTTLVSVVILIGSIFVSVGSSRSSYPLMVTGQVVYGLGGGMIVTMQEGMRRLCFFPVVVHRANDGCCLILQVSCHGGFGIVSLLSSLASCYAVHVSPNGLQKWYAIQLCTLQVHMHGLYMWLPSCAVLVSL